MGINKRSPEKSAPCHSRMQKTLEISLVPQIQKASTWSCLSRSLTTLLAVLLPSLPQVLTRPSGSEFSL